MPQAKIGVIGGTGLYDIEGMAVPMLLNQATRGQRLSFREQIWVG